MRDDSSLETIDAEYGEVLESVRRCVALSAELTFGLESLADADGLEAVKPFAADAMNLLRELARASWYAEDVLGHVIKEALRKT